MNTPIFILIGEAIYVSICLFLRTLYLKLQFQLVTRSCTSLSFMPQCFDWLSDFSDEV